MTFLTEEDGVGTKVPDTGVIAPITTRQLALTIFSIRIHQSNLGAAVL